MKYKEIKARDLKPKGFIQEKVREIRDAVGDGVAISALSGGVDSSVVTALAHRALADRSVLQTLSKRWPDSIRSAAAPRRCRASSDC